MSIATYPIAVIDVVEMTDLKQVEIKKEGGYYQAHTVNSKKFPNGVRVIAYNVAQYLLGVVSNERNIEIEKVKKLEKAIEKSERTLLALESEFKKILEQNEKFKSENETYRNLYGKLIENPYTLLQQLYNTGAIKKGRQLISPRNFKIYNTRDKSIRTGVNYWLSKFEEMRILDSDGNERYALVTYHRAKKILEEQINEKHILSKQ